MEFSDGVLAYGGAVVYDAGVYQGTYDGYDQWDCDGDEDYTGGFSYNC